MAELTELHRRICDGTDHVPAVEFEDGEAYDGSHGGTWTGGQPGQCMCGHPDYGMCPDWFRGDDEETTNG